MAVIVPTVNASTPEEYTSMLARAESLSKRIHIDICDGRFADRATINIGRVHPTEAFQVDLHLMVKDPSTYLHTALSIRPSLIIFHLESHGPLESHIAHVHELGTKVGLALLPGTSVHGHRGLIEKVDHVMIFTGTLSHNGGSFHADQLELVREIRAINATIEISVDGGINAATAAQAARHGVDVLYTGSYLQQAGDPQRAFSELTHAVGATT